jgi:AcrR family transcriptional regulator
MSRGSAQQVGVSTRERILDAAVLRFSRRSYESVGLRDIAADVGVDVSYVHRCFGSKEQLFAEAVESIAQGERIVADIDGDPGPALARQLLQHGTVGDRDNVGPLDIIIHSLSSPEASDILRKVIVSDFIDPLARKLRHPSGRQAGLIAAFLLGAGILRSVLRIDHLAENEDGALEREVARAIRGMARGSPRRRRTATKVGKRSKGGKLQ